MKILIKTLLALFLFLSLSVNSFLLVSKVGFEFLTDLMEQWGFNAPVVQMKKDNRSLKSSNQKLSSQNKKIKSNIRNYANKKQTQLVNRSSRKVARSSLKSTAAFIPAVANVVIAGSVALDVMELAEMCQDFNELETLFENIDFGTTEEKEAVSNYTIDKAAVCSKRITQVTKANAESMMMDIQKVSDEYFQQFKSSSLELSDEVRNSLDSSLNEWLLVRPDFSRHFLPV